MKTDFSKGGTPKTADAKISKGEVEIKDTVATAKASDNPVIRVAMQCTVGQTKVMTFETFVDQLTPVAVINALADRLTSVSDRQALKYTIRELELRLVQEENALFEGKNNVQRVRNDLVPKEVPGRKVPLQPSQKDLNELRNLETTLVNAGERIIKLRELIASHKKELDAS